MMMLLHIGDKLDHYEIRAHVVQGGTSQIYRGLDMMSGRDVAIKIPDPMYIGDPAQYKRFRREIEIVMSFQHPFTLHGIGTGRYNLIPYLVTEWIDGLPMRKLIETLSPYPVEGAVPLIRKIAEGIAYCHDNGVIHRDLKPENILLVRGCQPILIDFGLAIMTARHLVTLAHLSNIAGTPDYIAPEQVEGKRGDKRTDIYALGTIFYELLTGDVPFKGDNINAVLAQHLYGVAPGLDQVQPAISRQIAAVVMRCLERNPDQRYPDMAALINDLDHLDKVDTVILDTVRKKRPQVPLWAFSVLHIILINLFILLLVAVVSVYLALIRGH